MTNIQLAAARKVMNQYPQLRIVKQGNVLTPYLGPLAGASVEVSETMSESSISGDLTEACALLVEAANG